MSKEVYWPNNPILVWDGIEYKGFTYEPGKELLYVSYKDKYTMLLSVILWADSIDHAKDILRQAAKFVIENHATSCDTVNQINVYDPGRVEKWNKIIQSVNDGTISIVPCPRNHMLKIPVFGMI